METENPQDPGTVQPEVAELQAQVRWLRKQLATVLILAILISGTLTVFLQRQYKYSGTDLESFRRQASQVVNDYNRNSQAIDNFLNNLRDYTRTHPDFAPIAAKYGLTNTVAQ